MSQNIPILFGTETGNAEYCADTLVSALKRAGIASESIDMMDFNPSDIANHRVVLIITSTYGNGDPPQNAEDMLEYLQTSGLQLPGVNFAVCGLGDSSFVRFAQCGKDFEQALLDAGAKSMFERVDCDDDYDAPFERFKDTAVAFLKENLDRLLSEPVPQAAPAAPSPAPEAAKPADERSSRARPFQAPLLVKRLLSGPGSAKETMHYEFDLSGFTGSYHVGDCFGVHPVNSNQAIQAVLNAAGLNGAEQVEWQGETRSLTSALSVACLQQIGRDFIRTLAELPGAAGSPAATALAQGDGAITSYIGDRHVVDALLQQDTSSLTAQTLVDGLRKLQPRLYSVASSPTLDPNRVAFTAETLRYTWNDRSVEGVATCWLADAIDVGGTAPMHLVENEAFHFTTGEHPVIMVGPGTGIAPFRGYLQAVEAATEKNPTWLFFGHQHETTDFLYREEITRWLETGVLTKANFAWSRDQDHKIYVQNRIAEQGAELWSWIRQGAVIYVCGDAQGMAPAVADAFASLAVSYGGQPDGKAWLQKMTDEGRYRTDVY